MEQKTLTMVSSNYPDKSGLCAGMRKACHQNGLRLDFMLTDELVTGQEEISNPFFVVETTEKRVARLSELFPNHQIIIYEECKRDYKNVSTIHCSTTDMAIKVMEYLSAAGRKNVALFAFDIDSFNVEGYIYAYTKAAELLGCNFNKYDSYLNDENKLENCFEQFYKNNHKYNAVVCANDMAALYLITEATARGILVPDDLYVIGIGNAILCQNVSPGITSIDRLEESSGEQGVALWRYLRKNPGILKTDVLLDFNLHVRESTGLFLPSEDVQYPERDYYEGESKERGYDELICLRTLLANIDETDKTIMHMFVQGLSGTEIAEKTYLTKNGVRYRVKKIMQMVEKQNRQELIAFLQKYHVRF